MLLNVSGEFKTKLEWDRWGAGWIHPAQLSTVSVWTGVQTPLALGANEAIIV